MNTNNVHHFWQFLEGLCKLEPKTVRAGGSFFKCYLQDLLSGFVPLGGLENVRSADAFQSITWRHHDFEREDAGSFDRVIDRSRESHLLLAQTDIVAQNGFDLRLDRRNAGCKVEVRLQKPEGIQRSLH